MALEPFVDHVQIYFKSGKGGRGHVSFRREKYIPLGGPDGGDGGKGADIVLIGDPQLWTLLDLKYRKHITAPDGEPGGKNRKTGKSGKTVEVKVPLGTIIKNSETGTVVGEIKEAGESIVLLKGGIGGRGNWHFRGATHQSPEIADEGMSGYEMAVILELKVLADVGLVGFPNAGKSTLLAATTAAKPKIGAYPFTTLVPNLGIVKYHEYKSFVMADIPGIIEGAAEGKGLGIRFLRHIERNAVLLFLVPADSDDHVKEYETLLHELEKYNPDLLQKERFVVVSKSDILDEELKEAISAEFEGKLGGFISAVTGEGISWLKDEIWKRIHP